MNTEVTNGKTRNQRACKIRHHKKSYYQESNRKKKLKKREREKRIPGRRTGKKGLAVKETIYRRRRKRIKGCVHLRMSDALKNITMAYSFGTNKTMTRPSQRDSTTRGLARKGIESASGNSLTRKFACLSRFFSFFLELLWFISCPVWLFYSFIYLFS